MCYHCAAMAPVTPLEQKVEFSNLHDMFIITKACLGIFWPHFEKQDGHHRGFLDGPRVIISVPMGVSK